MPRRAWHNLYLLLLLSSMADPKKIEGIKGDALQDVLDKGALVDNTIQITNLIY